jgi:large subunit ribosomal protein L3
MTNPIIGQKIKMDQIFTETTVIPVTWVSVDLPEDAAEISVGGLVKIIGVSKGKGFQGVVKRYNFKGGPATHGQKNRHRARGSSGPTAPQRVIPGMRMAGRMGGDKKTLKRLKVIEWSAENKMMALKGSIPGRRGSRIKIYI